MKQLFIGLICFILLGTNGFDAQASFQAVPTPGNIRTSLVAPTQNLWSNLLDILAGRRRAYSEDQVVVMVRNARDQKPLAGATVQIGEALGVPFENNQTTTNAEGVAIFTNSWLKGKSFPVSAFKEEFGAASILNTNANRIEMQLEPHVKNEDFAFVEGKFYGWPTGYNKSTLEVGVFLPGISPASLLNFDPQQIVSSYKVEIDVYGKRLVPGNVVMPLQNKRYLLFPVTIEKETFVMPLKKGTAAHMSAVMGAVSISDAISLMKEKDFLGLINLADLTHVDWTERMEIAGNQRFDINVKRAIRKKLFSAKYENVPAKLDVVAIAGADPKGDLADLIATDVKSLKSEDLRNGRGAISLGGLTDMVKNSYIFSAFFDRNQFDPKLKDQFSTRALTGRLQRIDGNQIKADKMLQIIKSGSVSSDHRTFNFSSPNAPAAGLNADLLLLNIYAEVPNETTQGRVRKMIWTALLPGNSTSAQLPNIGKPVLPSKAVRESDQEVKFYWEVIAVKSRSTSQWKSEFNLKVALDNLEYVSSMAQKF